MPRTIVTYKNGHDLTIIGDPAGAFNILLDHARDHGMQGWRRVGAAIINMSEVQQVFYVEA
ncbi:hypothetical protein LOS78_05595 [Paracoccus sp. MA]|uniref:hypothetical protein n=1 Tax=Paracoccus sp. MA TaxID=2895796 RepID=UPI001E6356FC|nr:hypothetical protein [Paracoccus sp. MA]UFM63638.1 hypothetical protein LOS78_05595 [Paracoccus sp. MA]